MTPKSSRYGWSAKPGIAHSCTGSHRSSTEGCPAVSSITEQIVRQKIARRGVVLERGTRSGKWRKGRMVLMGHDPHGAPRRPDYCPCDQGERTGSAEGGLAMARDREKACLKKKTRVSREVDTPTYCRVGRTRRGDSLNRTRKSERHSNRAGRMLGKKVPATKNRMHRETAPREIAQTR